MLCRFSKLETSLVSKTLFLPHSYLCQSRFLILYEPFTECCNTAIGIELFGCCVLLEPGYGQIVQLNIRRLCGVFGRSCLGGRRLCEAFAATSTLNIYLFQMISTVTVGLGIVFLIYHTLLPERVVYLERPPITFDGSVLVLRPSTLILIAISKVQYLGRSCVLILSEVLVMILSAWRILLNETISALQWGGAFAFV